MSLTNYHIYFVSNQLVTVRVRVRRLGLASIRVKGLGLVGLGLGLKSNLLCLILKIKFILSQIIYSETTKMKGHRVFI